MNIKDCLRKENLRVSNGDKWLVIDDNGEYVVYEHKYRTSSGTEIYRGYNEEKAVSYLIYDK